MAAAGSGPPAAVGDVSIPVEPASVDAAAGGEEPPPPPRDQGAGGEQDNDSPEKQVARYVRSIVFGEWVGDGFGTLALVWATTVILCGFCSSLNRQDFWFTTFVIFVESIRIFSRSYKSDSQYLFGSARALRWISSSFPRMLVRPHVGNELVLVMGLWLNFIDNVNINFRSILPFDLALLILWTRQPQRPKQWQIRAVAIAYLFLTVYKVTVAIVVVLSFAHTRQYYFFLRPRLAAYFTRQDYYSYKFLVLYGTLPAIIEAGIVWLLLKLRPRRVVNLTSTPCGRRLISLAKIFSTLWLVADQLIVWYLPWKNYSNALKIFLNCLVISNTPITMLLLSLGSLQSHAAADSRFDHRCTDAILHIIFLLDLVQPIPIIVFQVLVTGLSKPVATGLSWAVVLVLLLIGNLQIPTAIAQIALSSLRLSKLLCDNDIDYSQEVRESNPNMVPAIAVFYLLALCQVSLYIMASFLALLSPFPRRWLMRKSQLGGELGKNAIDLYYDHAFESGMEKGVFGAQGTIMDFADFSIKSLNSSSSSPDMQKQAAGLYVLYKILLHRKTDRSTQNLILRVTSGSDIAVSSTLIGMLARAADVEKDGCDIRQLAALVTSELAGSLRISSIPGMLKTVSSLLNHAVVMEVPSQQTPIIGGCSYWVVCLFWQRMKEQFWSAPEDPALSLTHQDSSLPVLGMRILEELAGDLDNCAEILKDDKTNLISKTIGIVGYASTSENKQNDKLVCSSLKFLRRLATTGERIGVELRHELWTNPFLLTSLARALELKDRSSNSSRHQVWELAMDIIAKLALDKEAGLEIGKIQVITTRLLHAFLGQQRQGSTNMYYDQSLRKVSGEALANLALWGTANCWAILDEPGYQVINDLTNMLSDDDCNRYVTASLLLNICEHCNVDLSSALTAVMKHMKDAKGKQLELLINLASNISDVTREAFVHELESQTNSGVELCQKLIDTLNSKKIPNTKYPRMRRVIVKIVISILESSHHTVDKLMEQAGMQKQLLESLTKIEKSPSRVEDYRVFYGNIGVVLEDGEPMSTLVAKAKALLDGRTSQTAGAPTGHKL